MLAVDQTHATVRAAVALANQAPSVHNSQPWLWVLGDRTVHLHADPARALPATDPEGRDLRISCGAALHHLRVALLAAGLATRVHRLPDRADPGHLAAVELRPGEPLPDDLALAAAIERRRSDRRAMSTWPVPAGRLEALVAAAARQGGTLHVLHAAAVRRLAALAEHAAVEQALTPGIGTETAEWTGRSRAAAEGVPSGNVPTLPDGSLPVRHFAGRDLPQNTLGRDETDGAEVAVLTTPGDSPLDHLVAGEALSAVLLQATRDGLAGDPVSQPLEVPATRAGVRALVGGGEPQVVVRVGWPPVSAEPVPRTGRRPVEETIRLLDDPAAPAGR
ncbi:hypothetical protein [Modestobacter sp. NPDC049651]|uniref:Acg family FMN-binding oxidoreductase n=1 Tax=unclassified Modestobacter TaxID=2643866 RepID=UPI0033D7EE2B